MDYSLLVGIHKLTAEEKHPKPVEVNEKEETKSKKKKKRSKSNAEAAPPVVCTLETFVILLHRLEAPRGI